MQAPRDENRVTSLIGVDNTLFKTPTTIAVDSITHEILIQQAEKVPTDPTKLNPTTTLSYDVNGNLQYIDETIGAHVYRTTLSYTSNVLTGVSAAVQTS